MIPRVIIERLLGFAAGFLFVSAAIAVGDAPVDRGFDTTLVVQGFMFVTLIAGFIHQYTIKRQERTYTDATAKRIEEKADRDASALAAKVEAAAVNASAVVAAQATQVSFNLTENATKLAEKVVQTAERLALKVEAGTEKAVTGAEKAYTEANTVNEKIKGLQDELLKIGKSLLTLHEHVERTELAASRAATAVDETFALNKKVDAIIEERMRGVKKRNR